MKEIEESLNLTFNLNNEIKTLKSELELYKSYSNKQSDELKFYEGLKLGLEQNLKEFQENTNDLYTIQCANFNNCTYIIKVNKLSYNFFYSLFLITFYLYNIHIELL